MPTLVTDNFNRANGGLGANWTTSPPFTAPSITSNEILALATDGAFYSAVSFTNDQYGQIKLQEGIGYAGARIALNSGEHDGYYLVAFTTSTAIEIVKYTNNVGFTTLAAATRTTVGGDVLRLDARGTSLTGKVNGATVIGPQTDASFASGSPGLRTGSVGPMRLDDFEGGDLVIGVRESHRLFPKPILRTKR